MSGVECIINGADLLGEVPIWCERSRKLWWVDVRVPALQSLDLSSNEHRKYPLRGKTVGSWGLRELGGMIVSMEDGIHSFDPSTGAQERLVEIEADKSGHRLNEGRVDRRGRFWVGTMHDSVREPIGNFYRVTPNFEVLKVFDGVNIPNSVVMSPDDRIMYFADTPANKIWVFDFDIDGGNISNRRIFRDLTGHPGAPDGSAMDADGCLWNAEYGGSRVVRYTPKGEIDRIIQLPVSQVTCCAFGGEKLDTLYITTASQKLAPEELVKQPLAGGLFAIMPGVTGLPEARFAG